MAVFSGCKAVNHLINNADQCDLHLILLSFPSGIAIIYKYVVLLGILERLIFSTKPFIKSILNQPSMTYYCFNRCTEENFQQIEKLLSEYPFEHNDSDSTGSSLTCCPFANHEDKIFVSFRKFDRHGYPLVVQTHPGDKIDFNNNEQFKSILNRLMGICNPTSICDSVFREHDLK